MNILLTNVSYHCAVGVIKLIRKIEDIDIFIVGISSIPCGMSAGSMLVDKFYRVCDINNAREYLETIKSIYINEHIDFIISADEIELCLFYNDSFFNNKYIGANDKLINLFMDKYQASCSVFKNNIEIPKIISLDNTSEFNLTKYIIRENTSCCSKGIKIISNDDMQNIRKYISKSSFIQQFIDGTEYTVDVLADVNGKPIIIIPRKRIAVRSGITYKCEICKIDLLIDICKKICIIYHLPGFYNVQFIVKDNTAYFIELNPRLGGTTIASSLASFNLMELYLKHYVLHQPINTFEYYQSKIKWGTIVCRYFEETVLFGGNNISEEKNNQ